MIVVGFFVNAGYAQEKGKGAGSDPIAQLYAGAKKEGTVIIWGPTDAIIYQKMQAVLDKQYPGIKIEHFESIPEPLVQRIIAESQAGKPASVDQAIAAAADYLYNAHLPLVYGLSNVTCEAQRESVALAELVGGIIDSHTSL